MKTRDKELAVQAGWIKEAGEPDAGCLNLERFADLIRADALVKPCCGDFNNCQQICMPRAAAQEREACAKVCETEGIGAKYQGDVYAAAIRARSNK